MRSGRVFLVLKVGKEKGRKRREKKEKKRKEEKRRIEEKRRKEEKRREKRSGSFIAPASLDGGI